MKAAKNKSKASLSKPFDLLRLVFGFDLIYCGKENAAAMGAVDLHVHSKYSDGTLSPGELVDYALEKGLKAIALTDHDTVDGIDEITAYAQNKPVEIVPGIEYSTEYQGRDVHIVGLFIDHKSPAFLRYLARFRQSRDDRNHKLCANLRAAGINITCKALAAAFPDAVVTRAHYAKYLLDNGYVKSRKEAFDRYLGDHTPYFVHREKITPEEVIEVTRQAGGIPVLAHPTLYQLGQEQLETLIATLKKAGLMGMETIYSTYTERDKRRMKALAKKYRLLPSGGTDFHGENKPGLDLASGYGGLYVHESILEGLKKARRTKILFTDLDDTLLTGDKKISEKTRAKILEMLAAGYHFVLASGRPINSILQVLEQLDISRGVGARTGGIYATAYNGALLYDCIRREPIEGYGIAVETAQRLFDMAAARGLHIQTYTDTHIVSIAEDKELRFYTGSVTLPHIVADKLDGVLEHAPYKLIAIDLERREKLEAFREEVEASDIGKEMVCAFSNAQYLEFYNREAGKGNALVKLCRALNILLANAVAAGDEENDISMIEAAGIGAAMVNGNPALRERADYVTQNDNNHDGVAEIIDKFIL